MYVLVTSHIICPKKEKSDGSGRPLIFFVSLVDKITFPSVSEKGNIPILVFLNYIEVSPNTPTLPPYWLFLSEICMVNLVNLYLV